MKTLKVVSPAKLNLYLEVLNKRPDGYHNLHTLFERIDLADEIIFEDAGKDIITIRSDSREIPCNKDNLAYKAACLLKQELSLHKGVGIYIKKRIPVGAGLGGGSSNAASVLLGLNQLWKLGLSRKRLFEYAAKLGSDVAFFIARVSFAWGSSRGEKIKPAHCKRKLWHILLVPKVKVSTKEIYEKLDRFGWKNSPTIEISTATIPKILFNRLEETTFRYYPKVKQLKEALAAKGLKKVLMSGSGGSVFAIVASRKEGLTIAKGFQHVKGVKVFVVKTR